MGERLDAHCVEALLSCKTHTETRPTIYISSFRTVLPIRPRRIDVTITTASTSRWMCWNGRIYLSTQPLSGPCRSLLRLHAGNLATTDLQALTYFPSNLFLPSFLPFHVDVQRESLQCMRSALRIVSPGCLVSSACVHVGENTVAAHVG